MSEASAALGASCSHYVGYLLLSDKPLDSSVLPPGTEHCC